MQINEDTTLGELEEMLKKHDLRFERLDLFGDTYVVRVVSTYTVMCGGPTIHEALNAALHTLGLQDGETP